MLGQNAVVDGRQRIGARKAESEDAEVSLKTSVDGETAGGRVHTGHVLGVVNVFQR